ncbi:MAG: response regulator transcription factor [Arenicella sp.]
MIRILIVDDHQFLRQTLARHLNSIDNLLVVADIELTEQADRILAEQEVNVVLLDLNLPKENGLNYAKRLRSEGNNVPIVFMSVHKEPLVVSQALKVSNSSYMSKNDSLVELELALASIVDNKRYVSISAQQKGIGKSDLMPDLSKRELDVLTLIASGITQREIAGRLHISLRTVETHMTRIRAKTGLGNNAEIARYAIKIGLVSVE